MNTLKAIFFFRTRTLGRNDEFHIRSLQGSSKGNRCNIFYRLHWYDDILIRKKLLNEAEAFVRMNALDNGYKFLTEWEYLNFKAAPDSTSAYVMSNFTDRSLLQVRSPY
eukprot:GHVR01064615.1.p3 GENE.GHVR01064615.1~~GHVR01064615.1.p3  ORF type:complete len:109 (+),score=0.28 GHVR01064615.1:612-938(+)